jgi:hypothetical protein
METGWQRFALWRQLNPPADPSRKTRWAGRRLERVSMGCEECLDHKVCISAHPAWQRASRQRVQRTLATSGRRYNRRQTRTNATVTQAD